MNGGHLRLDGRPSANALEILQFVRSFYTFAKDFEYWKFAELIVQECVDIAYKYDEPKLSGPGMIIGNRIEEHFGVEE